MNQIARSPRQIGNLIQKHRKMRGMSQTELAARAGLRQELVSKIENGQEGSKISSICDLLAALDLEMTIGPRTKGSSINIEDIF